MTKDLPRLACAACGWTPGPPEVDPYPFRCPHAGIDDGDHVMSIAGQDVSPAAWPGFSHAGSPNPFIRYRTAFYSWHIACARGLSDAAYISIVEQVDAAIARPAGTGFRITPFCRASRLSAALPFGTQASAAPARARPDVPPDGAAGGVWVKDETGNVSGSHKARHLMGIAVYLEVLRRLGIDSRADRPLAVASCGNAALAAAVVARAIDRRLLVFVPDHASPAVVARLGELGAVVTRCSRGEGEHGDPSYLAFRRALSDGALPFSCQGNQNGLAIEGGMTLGYEIADSLRSAGQALDRVFIQVGGGALASACVQAFADCVRDGRLAAMPRVHAVQTRGAYPLKRAYDRLVDHILGCLAESSPRTRQTFTSDDERARYLLAAAPAALLDEAFVYARTHRSQFMWPWECEPHSVAGGILDDETYDWAEVVEAMIRTAGFPVVADEATIEESNALARDTTGIDVDHTGSSGLAGLLTLTRSLARPRSDERLALLFTGVRR